MAAQPGRSLRVRIAAEDILIARSEPKGISANNILKRQVTELRYSRSAGRCRTGGGRGAAGGAHHRGVGKAAGAGAGRRSFRHHQIDGGGQGEI